ncbi:MAG TPA: universal stress protein [Gemmatimonadales bacterium]|nr:universal stress protein [Gemmatimonadales bacterium]
MGRQGFYNILVPLDGSELAEQAVSVAGSLARRAGGTLRLAAVEEPLPALALPSEALIGAVDVEFEARAHTAGYLDSVADGVRRVQDGTVQTVVLEGPVASALHGYAVDEGIDLVVMTTRGRGGVSRWLTGSVADQLLRRTTVPVVLLHPKELPQRTQFGRILIALDGEIEDPVLEPALALGALEAGTRYTLTRVVEPAIPILTPLALYPSRPGRHHTERLVNEARDYLAGVCEKLASRGVEATYKVLVGRGIADQVLELATALGVDCIAVGTHRARGAERVVLGSVADRIVRGAEVPVLIGPTPRG